MQSRNVVISNFLYYIYKYCFLNVAFSKYQQFKKLIHNHKKRAILLPYSIYKKDLRLNMAKINLLAAKIKMVLIEGDE